MMPKDKTASRMGFTSLNNEGEQHSNFTTQKPAFVTLYDVKLLVWVVKTQPGSDKL